MGRTAFALAPEEWEAYRPVATFDQDQPSERWERAWQVALTAADVLQRRFGATKVVAFGSVAHCDWFTPWSDIDLGAS
jgi:hypothetical protein